MSKNPIPSVLSPLFQKEAELLDPGIKEQETFESLSLYYGLVFRQLKAEEFTEEEKKYCQKNLVILSALYGVLRPCDAIARYRLDFTKKGMYAFWGDKIYLALQEMLSKGERIINLASEEFSKTISRYLRKEDKFLTIEFYEEKEGELKKHSTISKKGRGLMARYLIEKQSQDLEVIRSFSEEGYGFCEEKSDEKVFVFIKK